MLKLAFPLLAFVIGVGALACSSQDNIPTDTGGSGGTGGSTGGAGGATGGAGGATGGAGGAGGFGACGKFNYGTYNPTMTPTLKNDIQPIFQISCALSSSCHTNGSMHHPNLGPSTTQLDGGKPSDMVLQGIKDELNKPSTEVGGRQIMVAGKPEDSYIVNKIDGSNNCSGFACMGPDKCGIQMPDPQSPLDPPQIELIRAWIKKGAM